MKNLYTIQEARAIIDKEPNRYATILINGKDYIWDKQTDEKSKIVGAIDIMIDEFNKETEDLFQDTKTIVTSKSNVVPIILTLVIGAIILTPKKKGKRK